MGKASGQKVQVTEYYMSQHFGICTVVDAIRKIIIKEKVAWKGYLTEQTKLLIQEDDLFGGATKEGGATGTIYFLPGREDQLLYDELADRLIPGKTGADVPGYRGLASVFFTGRPDANKGVKGFYWSANNPYLPGVWVEVRRAPVGLNPAYALVPRAGVNDFPFTSNNGLLSLLNSAITPNHVSLITTDSIGAGDHVRVWDLKTLTQVSVASTPIAVNGHDFGIVDETTFYATKTGPQLWLLNTDGGGSMITNDFDSAFVGGCQYVGGEVLILPAATILTEFSYYAGRCPARSVGFNVTQFFEDIDGQAWAIGPKRTGGDICICQAPLGAVTTIHTGHDGDCAAIDNGNGFFFVYQSDGFCYLIDKATLTITHTSTADSGYTSSDLRRQFTATIPGNSSQWIGFSEYNTLTGVMVRTVNPIDWKPTGAPESVYDPLNHAIISGEPFTDTDITWRFLDRAERDANPAHIIYECLINTDWGMGCPLSLIDFDNFDAVGVVLYNEPLGLSLLWTRQASIQDFIQEILDHIQGVLFVDPQTGLLTLKLIRGDYDPDTLPIIDPSNATLTNFGRKLWGEIVNEINVTWTNPASEQDETVTVQDLASIVTQGIVSDSRNYYGVRYALLAQRLAARDLRSSGAPLASCEAEVDRSEWFLRPASVLKVDWPEYGLDGVVMRVTSIDYGKPGDPALKLSLVEDVFGLDIGDYVEPPSTAWTDTSQPPTPMTQQKALTLPYFFAFNGPTSIADAVYAEVMAGVFGVSSNPDVFNYELWGQVTLAGGGTQWQSLATLTVVGYATLAADLAAEATSAGVSFAGFIGTQSPERNGFAFIGDAEEDSEIALITGASSTFILSRGVLDTVPKAWASGAPVWFVAADSMIEDPTTRSSGEVVSYKLRTRTSQGLLPLAAATLGTATLTDRPWLPSRPANVTIGGVQFNDITTAVNMTSRPDPWVMVTWSNRNRQNEDTLVLNWTDSTVALETGQTTTIRVYGEDGVTVLATHTGITGTTYDVPDADFGSHSIVLIRLFAERTDADGTFESLQGHGIWVRVGGDAGTLLADGQATASFVSSLLAGSVLSANGSGAFTGVSGAVTDGAFAASGVGGATFRRGSLDPLWSNVVLLVYGEGADGSTSFTDYSSVARALTANGNVQHDTGQDVHGQSIKFDGTGDYISMLDGTDVRLNGATSPTNDFCLEGYFYLTNLAHINQLFNKQAVTGTLNDYEFFVDTAGKLNFKDYGSGVLAGAAISAGSVPTGQIVHLAVSRQAATFRLFINGTLDGTATQTGSVGPTSAALNIGHNARFAGQDLEGWANWLRFTKGAARYTASFTLPSTPFPAG